LGKYIIASIHRSGGASRRGMTPNNSSNSMQSIGETNS